MKEDSRLRAQAAPPDPTTPLAGSTPGTRPAYRTSAGPVAWSLATLCGVGHFPFAPGTIGSLASLVLWWGVQRAGGAWGALALGVLLALTGVWAADRVSSARGITDPSEVVVDEAAGMILSLAFLPASWEFIAAAFLLFRILDVTKPWPADAAERLPGGLGVMADDLVCGAYTNLLLQVAAWVLA